MSDQRPMPRGDAMENLVIAQMRDDLRAARRRRRFGRLGLPGWSILTTAAAAVVAVIAITVSMLAAPQRTYAATPPMLHIEGAQGGVDDAAELLTDLARQLRASGEPDPAPPGHPQQIDVQTWGLVTTVGTEGEKVPPPYVAPENVTFTRYPDGAWSQVVVAGTPYDTQGKPVDDPHATPPGTELWRIDEAAGEHTFLFPDPVPDDPDELRQLMLDAGLSEDPTTSDWISQAQALLMERVLRPSEEAALLEVLAGLDLELAGTTTDRLGREAYVFETPSGAGDFVDRILVSPRGHVLATENVWVGHDRTDIPSPSVLSYFAWEGRS
jgi:hypothetical protein